MMTWTIHATFRFLVRFAQHRNGEREFEVGIASCDHEPFCDEMKKVLYIVLQTSLPGN